MCVSFIVSVVFSLSVIKLKYLSVITFIEKKKSDLSKKGDKVKTPKYFGGNNCFYFNAR